jgi:hypothetical protein
VESVFGEAFVQRNYGDSNHKIDFATECGGYLKYEMK